ALREWPALLELSQPAAAHLARRDPGGARWRGLAVQLLRFLDRRTRSFRTRGLTVALLAPDGAGKTTLARSLGEAFYLPTRYIYMGANPQSGSIMLPTTPLLAQLHGGSPPPVRGLGGRSARAEAVRWCMRWVG